MTTRSAPPAAQRRRFATAKPCRSEWMWGPPGKGGVRGGDVAFQRGGQAPGDGHQAVLVVFAVAYLEGRAGRVEVAQFQAECFGQPQASAVEHPEQHRVDRRPVRVL